MTTETFTTPGQFLWVAPFTGTVQVECWGAGGGGGSFGSCVGGYADGATCACDRRGRCRCDCGR